MAQKKYSSNRQSSETELNTKLVLLSRKPQLFLEFNKPNNQNLYEINSFNKYTDWCRESETSKHHYLKPVWNEHITLLSDANVPVRFRAQQRALSTAHYSSRPTVSKLKGVSDTISNWFENHRPQRTQISTVTNAPFRSKLESGGLQGHSNRKFSESSFSTPAIFKATSKVFGSLRCSDDKNWLDLNL